MFSRPLAQASTLAAARKTSSARLLAAAYSDFAPSSLDAINANRFDDAKLQASVTEDVWNAFQKSRHTGEELSKENRNAVANALYEWSRSKGAVQYAHIFYPIRGAVNGSHGGSGLKFDSFVDLDFGNSHPLKPFTTGFNGSKLYMNETDGSSFPNGGLRVTHTAAAYMGWDQSSPPYIRGDSLFIPSSFVAYTGAALDEKTPLLRSSEAINKEGVRLRKHLGFDDEFVVNNNGCEQEFFVISRDNFLARPDLIANGRTVCGAASPRGQESCANYFGKIPQSVRRYLTDVRDECWAAGIGLVTMHNEVAPGQHELAPMFSLTNVSADSNILLMEIMEDVATHHDCAVLFAEKPFAGINGSGKHCNWGLNSPTDNLFVPGKTAESQASFVAFTAALTSAVHKYGDLIRCGVATYGNDFRLGAQEAPPAIMSIYPGASFEAHLRKVMDGGDLAGYASGTKDCYTGTPAVATISGNAEDRNRTAPFPWCSNRFEFRAVGSNQNIAWPMALLNTAMAGAMSDLSDKIEGGLSVRDAVAETLKESEAAIFVGDGYSQEWADEAERRGLLNLKNTPKAFDHLANEKNTELVKKMGVFSSAEINARAEIGFERYAEDVRIEADVFLEMIDQAILPACAADLKSFDGTALAGNRGDLYANVAAEAEALRSAYAGADGKEGSEAAHYYADTVKPAMDAAREAVDAAEK
eukprot:UC4_evm1s679